MNEKPLNLILNTAAIGLGVAGIILILLSVIAADIPHYQGSL